MQIQEIKDNFKKIITGLNYDKPFEDALIKIVEEYDGKDPGEFFDAFSQVMLQVSNFRELTIKAEAYDKIVEIEKDYSENITKLKTELVTEGDKEQSDLDELPYTTDPDF